MKLKEINFMSFENLTKLIEEHKKETHPYKRYEFDSTCYTLLLIDINKLLQENQKLKEVIDKSINYISSNDIEVLKYYDIPSETTSYEIVTVDLLKILKESGE